MISRLPPKQIMLDSFIEERRCGLQRWLRLISQHPVISSDEIFKTFLTITTGDHLQQMQNVFESDSDELSLLSKDHKIPQVDLFTLVSSREIMRTRLNQVVKLKRLLEQQAKREINQNKDFQELAATVTAISDENFKDFSEKFMEIAKESEQIAENQQLAVTERFLMIIDVLTAHSDLCERIEKNLDADRSRRNFGEFYEHELKRRKSFALFCIAEESRLAEKYLKILPSILLQFSFEESKGLGKIAENFKKIVDIESDKINCEDEIGK
jgi:sorting nexin-8